TSEERVDRVLSQVRPSGTAAVAAYTLAANRSAIVTGVVVANTTGIAATFRLFFHATGATYDQTTALFYDKQVAANDSFHLIDLSWGLATAGGSIGVRTDTIDALTFTFFGEEITTL
ncbi:MAG: hypothetical protein COW34_01000, partial [Armatimonadetes bacterium CG17_big_fil_post_rev_8_21_14_2_50_66_6]